MYAEQESREVPCVTGVSPRCGPAAGFTLLRIRGDNLGEDMYVGGSQAVLRTKHYSALSHYCLEIHNDATVATAAPSVLFLFSSVSISISNSVCCRRILHDYVWVSMSIVVTQRSCAYSNNVVIIGVLHLPGATLSA